MFDQPRLRGAACRSVLRSDRRGNRLRRPFHAAVSRPGRASTETAPAHDLDVVDEAIVKAVAHRDYAIAGSKIRLLLFADRLELYSPGKLPNTITLDDIPYRTFTRNQLLVSGSPTATTPSPIRRFVGSRAPACNRTTEPQRCFAAKSRLT